MGDEQQNLLTKLGSIRSLDIVEIRLNRTGESHVTIWIDTRGESSERSLVHLRMSGLRGLWEPDDHRFHLSQVDSKSPVSSLSITPEGELQRLVLQTPVGVKLEAVADSITAELDYSFRRMPE